MAVLKMQKISICALKKDRKAILEQLQHLGVLEVDREKEEDAFFQKMDTTGQRMKFEKAATAADQALGILDAYAPEKKSLLSSLEGKELIDRELEEKVQISGPELIKTARGIYDLDREYAELRAGIAKIENQIESLMPWMALDVPLQEGKTKRTALILGTMPGELTLENIYSILLEKTPEVMEKTGVDVHLVSAESNMICIAVICLKEQLQTVEEALRSAGFARPSQNWSKTPKEQKEVLETEIAASRERMTQCEAELKSLASKRKELQAVADYYRVRADKYAVLGELLQSKRTFVISGYIPACESGPVEKSLTEKYNCMVDIAKFFLQFTVDESCGKCTPCRIGTKRLYEMLEKITSGNATMEDLDKMEKLCYYIKNNSLCGLGQTAPNPVLSTLRYFKDEYIAHVKDKRCPAGVCQDLLTYKIIDLRCKGCTACARGCPVGAISGTVKQPHSIDTTKCIKCGACMAKCKFGAIIKE